MLKVLAPAVLLAALAVPAMAMPLVQDAISDGGDGARIIQIYGGCGPYAHRGVYGYCRPGGQWGGYIRGASCPAGFHIGPYGRRSWNSPRPDCRRTPVGRIMMPKLMVPPALR